MLCARVTLTAGPHHKRYKPGAFVRAMVFAKGAEHPDDLEGEAFTALVARGWKRMTIDGHKLMPDDQDLSKLGTAESEAFRAALDKGIGVGVLGMVQ
jgi:hypothetical protein